jgi:PAP2 superfamily protein
MGSEIPDNNPLAAMPSLHVALPLLISLWFFRERWKMPAIVMLVFAALVAFEVTFSGEHYVIDVAGAVVVAGVIALVAQLDYRRALSRLSIHLPSIPRDAGRPASDHLSVADGAQPGLASRPGAIFLATGALVVVVSIKVALALFAGVAPVSDTTFTSDALEPPTSLTASGGSAITLVWTPSPDSRASGYRVLRGTASGGPYMEVARVTPRTVTTFTDTPAAGTYFYVLCSFFENRSSVNSNETSANSDETTRR